ncbi:MAG: TIGR02221 family CRISPR-associated protein [Paludibacteraceae bacterium]|jgi:CRISPR-associated Csx2 family protein|nr:TIGR02221 family CRISPR-associated protein [Paludibacteraceae bacterium]
MSKVLISFLGTSQKVDNRKYRTADYKFNDGETITTSFIADAIRKHYKVDKLILIGTVRSMWEEVYETFCGEEVDSDYSLNLYEYCVNANSQTDLYLPSIEKIEQALGKDSKVVLIKYGLNEQEILFNQETILGIDKYLEKNDELILDITHSFRSLPLFLLNTIIYLQNVSLKNISISHVLYGMLDVSRELTYTPVVDLKSLLNTSEWIVGAYSFKEFGNAYKIANLLKDENKSVYKRLIRFSDAKNLNYYDALSKQVQELQALRGDELPAIAQIVVEPIVEDYIRRMTPTDVRYMFQLKLAEWHFKKMNYSSSYLCLTESIISYVCTKVGLDDKNKENRDKAKDLMFKDGKFQPLRPIFNKVNSVRKQLAHNVEGAKRITDMIDILENGLNDFKGIINTK